MTKFCKDCKYYKKGIFDDYGMARCLNSQYAKLPEYDRVSGKQLTNGWNYCDLLRKYDYADRCSPAGRGFEPKRRYVREFLSAALVIIKNFVVNKINEYQNNRGH